MTDALPYKIACLCDLRDAAGRVLLLHRKRAPNEGLASPIGGKLDMPTGESPAQNALREIWEEAGLRLSADRLHLAGLISETAYEGRTHWLIFYYRVLGPVEVPEHDMAEGRLAWHRPDQIDSLRLPDSDRRIIWPLIRSHGGFDPDPWKRPSFFAVHIDCRGPEMAWTVEQG